MNDENLDYCINIRNKLEQCYRGEFYKCPDCGELINIPNINNIINSTSGLELSCGCHMDSIDDLEQQSLYDYFNDALDITYYISSYKEFRGVRIMVAYGAPNIYIDTYRREIELYNWTETAKVCLDSDLCDAIDEAFEEIYDC